MKSAIFFLPLLLSSFATAALIPNGRRDPADASLQKQYVTGIDTTEMFDNSLWPGVFADKYRFAMIESSHGESQSNSQFSAQNTAARGLGLLTGPIHVADPSIPGTTPELQATVFSQVGGIWQADGQTLPGALKLADPQNGPACFGLIPDGLGYWIKKFAIQYRSLTQRYPTILSTDEWLENCLGVSMSWIPASSRLWIIHEASTPRTIPGNWSSWTFWQADRSKGIFNYNLFNGNEIQLKKFADNV